MLRRVISIAATCIMTAAILPPGLSSASGQTASGSGLRVSPVRTNLTIDPGQTKTVPVNISDPTSTPLDLQVVINDFKANGTTGEPELILNGASDLHGLSQFVAPIKNVSLAAGQQVTVNVVITIPKNNPGGGYYGAVRFEPVSTGPVHSLTLSANVASLILVKVPGPSLKEQLNVSKFNVENNGHSGRLFFGGSGLSAAVTFSNSGNVQEEPFGKIEVQSGSLTIMTQAINNTASPGNVLPGSSRIFSVPLKGLGSLGKYKVVGYFGYGSAGQLLSAQTAIYVVAVWVIIAAVGLLALIILAIWFLIHTRRRHSRVVIERD